MAAHCDDILTICVRWFFKNPYQDDKTKIFSTTDLQSQSGRKAADAGRWIQRYQVNG